MVTIIDKPVAIGNDVSNEGQSAILAEAPYRVEVQITGAADILFHRWQSDEVEAKAKANKNSSAKKHDNIESYVYRCENGNLALPGTYLLGSITSQDNGAAKYRQDPRSPRKSALSLYRAGVVALTPLADLGVKDWDYEDRARVRIQGSAITRVRPALHSGWQATFHLLVLTPEYITPMNLHEVLNDAGRLVGIGDHRPTYGRFQISHFELLRD